MSDDSEKDKAVAAFIRGKVMDYATELLFVEGVSDKQQEIATRELAEAFQDVHQYLVESRKKLETEEGKAETTEFKNRLVEMGRKFIAERSTTWGTSVKEERRSCSHPTHRQKT
jgi:hypothetical protein